MKKEELSAIQQQLNEYLLGIPNVPDAEVPEGVEALLGPHRLPGVARPEGRVRQLRTRDISLARRANASTLSASTCWIRR